MLNKGAIWTYWEGAYRDTGRDEGATMVLQTANKKGWFWYIPQHDNIVSVGVVAPFDYLFKGRGELRADLRRGSRALPGGARSASSNGRRASTGYFATKDYSYRSTQVAGDGWVLVGDAFGFLDPLYSSGVLLALQVGRAGRRRDRRRAREGRHVSAAQLGKWGPASTRASTACGGWSASTTTASASATSFATYPHLRGTVTDLLIGDLFNDRVDTVWGPMESLYEPGKTPIPPWNAGTPGALDEEKVPHLELPDGRRPVSAMATGFRYSRRVQFSETDLAGIAHFSAYFRFMEEAEHALWRAAGLSIGAAEKTGGWPRVAAAFDYKRPLRFEDEFEVTVCIAELTRRSIRYTFTITRGDALVGTGTMTAVCTKKEDGQLRAVDLAGRSGRAAASGSRRARARD